MSFEKANSNEMPVETSSVSIEGEYRPELAYERAMRLSEILKSEIAN